MPDTLPVQVNHRGRNSLDVPGSFETDDSFVIEVTNHGSAGRVHVHLDEALSAVASVEATNHYVEAKGTTTIPVSVHEKRDVFGKLKLVSGYGATTRWVDVSLTEPDDAGAVEVDEELAKPQPREPTEGSDSRPGPVENSENLPLLAFGALAVLVAIAAAIYWSGPLVTVGALGVVTAVLGALYYVLQ